MSETRAHLANVLALLVVALAGCGSSGSSPARPPPPPSRTAPILPSPTVFAAPGAPDAHACTTAADCTYGGFPTDSGCSYAGTAVPHTHAFHDWWISTWLPAHCPGGQLPRINPSQPRSCQGELRCTAGRCSNTCP